MNRPRPPHTRAPAPPIKPASKVLVYAAHCATHGRASCARAGSAPRANCTHLHGDTGCGHLRGPTGSPGPAARAPTHPLRTGASFGAVSPGPAARVLSDLTTRRRAARGSSWGYTLHQPDHRPPPLSRTPARGAAVLATPLKPAPRTHEPRLVECRTSPPPEVMNRVNS